MTYLHKMLRLENSVKLLLKGKHRLTDLKRKRLAVLAKPRRCKPGTVNVFCMAWD